MDPIQKLDIVTVQYVNQFRSERFVITGHWRGSLGLADFQVTVNLLRDGSYNLGWFERNTPLDEDVDDSADASEFKEAMTVYTLKIRDRHRELMMRLVYEATNVFKESTSGRSVS